MGSRAAQVLRPRSDQQGADRERSSARIDALFAIEREINGLAPPQRLRCARSTAGHSSLIWRPGCASSAPGCPSNSDTGKAIDYSLKRWAALTRFLDDGRLCMTNNAAERELRAVAVGRRNRGLFAGSDRGAPSGGHVHAVSRPVYAARGIRRFMPTAELCRTGLFSPGFTVSGV